MTHQGCLQICEGLRIPNLLAAAGGDRVVRGARGEPAREQLKLCASFQAFESACCSTPEARVDRRVEVDAPLKLLQTEISLFFFLTTHDV